MTGTKKGDYRYEPPAPGTPSQTRRQIEADFARWNKQAGEEVITDWDLPMAQNGQTGASVVFYLRGRKVPVSVTKWADFPTNLKAAQLVINRMRLNEACGAGEAAAKAAEAAYGLVPVDTGEEADLNRAYALLQVRRDADLEVCEASYRRLVNNAHPDKPGGSHAKMSELNNAIDLIRQSRPGR